MACESGAMWRLFVSRCESDKVDGGVQQSTREFGERVGEEGQEQDMETRCRIRAGVVNKPSNLRLLTHITSLPRRLPSSYPACDNYLPPPPPPMTHSLTTHSQAARVRLAKREKSDE